MPDDSESVKSHISLLASTDALEREEAAHALFRFGCAIAEPILRSWFAVPEFRALARSGSSLLTVGVAVEPRNFERIRAMFGQPRLAEVPDRDVLEFELTFKHGVRLDILSTREPSGDGTLARFLRRFGEAIQQVECDVRDVSRATELLRKRFGIESLYPEAREGADRTRVNFFLVPLAEGRKVLIELVEVPARKGEPR
jgi:hypothetical protein